MGSEMINNLLKAIKVTLSQMGLKLRLANFRHNPSPPPPFAQIATLEVPLEKYIHPGNCELTLSTSITHSAT